MSASKRFCQGFHLVRKHFNPGNPIFHPFPSHRGNQEIALFRDEHIFTKQFLRDRSCTVHRKRDMPRMLQARHLIGVFHHLLDVLAEPDIDGLVNQPAREQRQQDGRNQ
jgi:hypothetical protein